MTVTNLSTGGKILAHLVSYDLKELSGNRYRSRSPLRADSDSRSFSLFIHEDGEHGMFKDFGDGEGGSLYKLAKQLGIETPTHDTSATSKRAYAGLVDYSLAHGTPSHAFTYAGWREGALGGRPCLFYPTTSGERWRYLDGNQPKYGSKSGYKSCWYGLRKALAMLIDSQEKTLVLVNGEASVIAAQWCGIAAACITNSGERSDLPPDLLQELKESLIHVKVNIVVAFDCDAKGRSAAPLLANNLSVHGFQAEAVDLGLGFDGADIADFCKLYDDQALAMLLKCATLNPSKPADSSSRKWEIVNRDYMRTLPPVKWLIPDQIQDHAVNVLVGPPKQGKSFLAIDYAASLAQQHRVVYMLGEGDRGINPRVAAWEKHHGKLTDKNLFFCKGAVEIMLASDLDDFIETIRPLQPKLVIVDTLARSMLMGDENNGKDMKNFVAGCSRIVDDLDCAVLLVHHTRKDNGIYRGSNVLEGNVDVMLFLTMQDEVIELKSSALKEQAASDSLYFRLIPKMVDTIEGIVEAAVIIPAGQFKEDGSRLTQNQRAILTLLADDEDESYYRRDLVESLRIPLGTVTKAVKTLKTLGYIESAGKNSPYAITESGRKCLTDSIDSHVSLNHGESVHSVRDTTESIESWESMESIDDFESYAIGELGADIEPLPSQAAFIQPRTRYE